MKCVIPEGLRAPPLPACSARRRVGGLRPIERPASGGAHRPWPAGRSVQSTEPCGSGPAGSRPAAGDRAATSTERVFAANGQVGGRGTRWVMGERGGATRGGREGGRRRRRRGRALTEQLTIVCQAGISRQAWGFGNMDPYGENSLQSDQTATSFSRRQNAILVTFSWKAGVNFELGPRTAGGRGGPRPRPDQVIDDGRSHAIFSAGVVFSTHRSVWRNSLQSDQTATNSSRRQNTILVTFFQGCRYEPKAGPQAET